MTFTSADQELQQVAGRSVVRRETPSVGLLAILEAPRGAPWRHPEEGPASMVAKVSIAHGVFLAARGGGIAQSLQSNIRIDQTRRVYPPWMRVAETSGTI